MNEFAKTGLFLGGAAVLCVLAGLSGPRAIEQEAYRGEGDLFFPNFTDPALATELEVFEFREESSELSPFKVKRNDRGVWTIPSHWDYPADAKDRMAKSASMLIGIHKDRFVGDNKEDHARFGVVDPKDPDAEAKGRGIHVAFRDKAGSTLGELIIGKQLEGKTDSYYVRVPDKKQVYACKIDSKLSTKFADWIETDLLKAQSWDISQFLFDNYSIDEAQRRIVPGDRILAKKDDSSKWTLDGLTAEEQANEEKLREVADTLGQIKIVGVRPKPEGLTAALKQANGFEGEMLLRQLQAKGYFLLQDGRMVSNEGDLLFQTRKGIEYTLRFGEIAVGEGDELTAGAPAKEPKAGANGPQGPEAKVGNNRYLMVTAEFKDDLIKKPVGVRLAEDVLDKRRQARTAIEAITSAIDAYRSKHDNKVPETLAALTEKPGENDPPLLTKLEQDPWGSDYVLQPSGDSYSVASFGEDKKEGGEGAAQDIRSDQFAKEDDFARWASDWKEYDRKRDEGTKEATKLTKRFGPWYYVIDDALFKKLKPTRADLVKPKDKPAENGAAGGNGEGPVK